MTGTRALAVLAMRLTPPKSTNPTNSIKTAPVMRLSISKAVSIAPATAFAWTMLPIPNAAMVPNNAKAKARGFHFSPMPFLM